jgi:hypothetical protein
MNQRYPVQAIDPEEILAQASADGHVLVVTAKLVRVGADDRVRLNVMIEDVRRIQFDIERDRPATLVIVPDSPSEEAQVISVPAHEYVGVAHALAVLGLEMAKRKE